MLLVLLGVSPRLQVVAIGLGGVGAVAAAHALRDALLEQDYRRQEGEEEEHETREDVVVKGGQGEGEAAVVVFRIVSIVA